MNIEQTIAIGAWYFILGGASLASFLIARKGSVGLRKSGAGSFRLAGLGVSSGLASAVVFGAAAVLLRLVPVHTESILAFVACVAIWGVIGANTLR